MALLKYDEFVESVRRRPDAGTNGNVLEFLSRYGTRPYNESGHFKQAYWATTLFFIFNPDAKAFVQALPPNDPVDLTAHEDLLENWRYFLNQHRGDRSDVLGFDLETLYRGLHENLGGRITSGGGAGFPLKIIMRLVADLTI